MLLISVFFSSITLHVTSLTELSNSGKNQHGPEHMESNWFKLTSNPTGDMGAILSINPYKVQGFILPKSYLWKCSLNFKTNSW